MTGRRIEKNPVNIICFGDSITHAQGFAEGDRWPTLLQYRLNEWRPEAYRVFNRGVGGNTSAQGFDRFSEVDRLLPGIVLIQFGFNDANVREPSRKARVCIPEFKLNMREFARMIGIRKGKSVFIVNHTIGRGRDQGRQGNGKSYAANVAPYNPAIREVARKTRCPLIDLPVIMIQRGVALKAFLAEDDLHLTAAGNHTYADMVFETLKDGILLPDA